MPVDVRTRGEKCRDDILAYVEMMKSVTRSQLIVALIHKGYSRSAVVRALESCVTHGLLLHRSAVTTGTVHDAVCNTFRYSLPMPDNKDTAND